MTLNRALRLCALVLAVTLAVASCASDQESGTTPGQQQHESTSEDVAAGGVGPATESEEPLDQMAQEEPLRDPEDEVFPEEDAGSLEVEGIYLSTSSLSIGDELVVEIRITNTARGEQSRNFVAELDGTTFSEFEVSVGGSDDTTHTLAMSPETPGEHVISIEGKSATFSVLPVSSSSESKPLATGGTTIHILGIDRHDEQAILWFWIKKGRGDWLTSGRREITVLDDHGNSYTGSLRLDIGGASADAQELLPAGFGYAETVGIGITGIAPIERILLDGESLDIPAPGNRSLPQSSDWLAHSADFGQEIQIGDWANYSLEEIERGVGEWDLPLRIGNSDYVELEAEIELGLQHNDGSVSWRSRSARVDGASEEVKRVALPTEMWVDDRPAEPRCIILRFSDGSSSAGVLTIFPLSPNSLPPLVGQGPERQAEVFQEAYELGGGESALGYPSNMPEWFRGEESPSDMDDVVFQLFPTAPRWGGAAIVWDKTDDAYRAWLLPGGYWQAYVEIGGPYMTSTRGTKLGAPVGQESSLVRFEGGALQDVCSLNGIANTTNCVLYLPPPFRTLDFDSGNGTQLRFSPDGSTLLVLERSSQTRTPFLLSTASLTVSGFLAGEVSAFKGIAYSPDGKYIASTHTDDSICIWDASTLSLLRRIQSGQRNIGQEIAFHPDSSRFAILDTDGTRIWDCETGLLLSSIPELRFGMYHLSGRSAFGVSEYSIKLIDAASGRIVRSFDGHSDWIYTLDTTSDGKILASGSSDESVILWNVDTGEIIRRLRGHEWHVNSVCFSPNGTVLASASGDGTVRLWSLENGQQLAALHAEESWQGVEEMAISPDGSILVSASRAGVLEFWDLDEIMESVLTPRPPR